MFVCKEIVCLCKGAVLGVVLGLCVVVFVQCERTSHSDEREGKACMILMFSTKEQKSWQISCGLKF